jgi:hypothetical protein
MIIIIIIRTEKRQNLCSSLNAFTVIEPGKVRNIDV